MKCYKGIISSLLAASFLFSSGVFAVPTLNFTLAAQTVELGDQATVNVGVSGLTNEYVEAYNFNVNWDSSILSLDSVTFGSFLGGPLSSNSSSTPMSDSVNVSEISLGPLGGQDGFSNINLFSLTFNTLSIGTSLLSFSGGTGSWMDFRGNDLGSALNLSSGSINVIESTSVPGPGSLWLLGIGLVVMGVSRHRRLQH